jgi:membrane dipeptidase
MASKGTAEGLATEAVRELYRDSIVIDGSIAPTMDEAQLDRMKRSGVTAFNWTVCSTRSDLAEALLEIAEGLAFIDAHPYTCLIRSVADIEAAKRDGKVGLIFGPQNAKPAETDLRYFRVLRELGVTIVQLTYNEHNLFGSGSTVEDGGLTPAGREAIAEMNRVGIVVDLSHCGHRTTMESIEASAEPVLITHANSYSVFASPRNKTDEHLRALAARGGVIGLTLWSPMVGSGSWPGIADFLRHVEYVANLIGPEHIGLGSDHSEGTPRDEWEGLFGPGGKYPSVTASLGSWYGYDTRFIEHGGSCVDIPQVVEAIATLGFSQAELQGILGGNMLRVCRQVWGA